LTRHRRFCGRLEHLRGSALGFRNLTNYAPSFNDFLVDLLPGAVYEARDVPAIARSLLEAGGFRPHLHRRL
jgi:hypothetical protein